MNLRENVGIGVSSPLKFSTALHTVSIPPSFGVLYLLKTGSLDNAIREF